MSELREASMATIDAASRQRSERRPVGVARTAAPAAGSPRPSASVAGAGLGRRNPAPGAVRLSVAGRSATVRAVVAGVCAVRLLAGARDLAAGRGRTAGPGRRGRQAVVAGVVDSTTSRAHIHAAGARQNRFGRVAGEPDHHALGRSGGGWGTKTHAAVDQRRGVLSFILTPGQDGDSPQLVPVLDAIRVARPGPGRPRCCPTRVLADKAHSSKANRAWLRRHGIAATIPVPADQAGHCARRGHGQAHRRRRVAPVGRSGLPRRGS